jgi:hypothetical protein
MPGITLAIAEAKVALWSAAEDAVALGQAVASDSGRSLTRADLGEIRATLEYWQNWVEKLTPRPLDAPRQRRVIVVDA